jgi:hypothetical protein
MRISRLLLAAVIPLLATSVACGENEDEEKKEAAAAFGAACDLKAADPAAALPSDVPAGFDGVTFYELQTQGSTKRYFGYAKGDDVVKVRDQIRSAYAAAAYEIEGSDAEPPAEAEFEWKKGSNEGSVQVTPLCKETVRIRYRVGAS